MMALSLSSPKLVHHSSGVNRSPDSENDSGKVNGGSIASFCEMHPVHANSRIDTIKVKEPCKLGPGGIKGIGYLFMLSQINDRC